MKSVKAKLFAGFACVIFIILLGLSFVSVQLFSFNQKNDLYESIEFLMEDSYDFVKNNSDQKIKELDRFVVLQNQFVIVVKNDKLLYSSESSYKTNRILEEVYEEFEHESDDIYPRKDYQHDPYDKEHGRHYSKRFEEDEFLILYDLIEKNDNAYEIIAGIDEKSHELDMADIVSGVIILNITIFTILLVLGYLLINRTIKPLKQILLQMETLRQGDDLSKRLEVHKSNDEFERLAYTFNEMLGNIENSVENIKQFSSDASHELKTPLTIIQGQIELCQKDEVSIETLKESLSKIDDEQKKLQEIIQNFVLLSRLEKEKIKSETTLLDEVVFDVIENNLASIESKNLELKLDIQEGIEVNFHSKYLSMVVNNLVTNAIKYTNEGFIELKVKKEDDRVSFEVSDSGIGIASKDIENIFERFYRVDKVRTQYQDGIGLGLSIVKKICEHFDAKIKVRSELHKGSSFTITFQ